jgi:hypothetical protein
MWDATHVRSLFPSRELQSFLCRPTYLSRLCAHDLPHLHALSFASRYTSAYGRIMLIPISSRHILLLPTNWSSQYLPVISRAASQPVRLYTTSARTFHRLLRHRAQPSTQCSTALDACAARRASYLCCAPHPPFSSPRSTLPPNHPASNSGSHSSKIGAISRCLHACVQPAASAARACVAALPHSRRCK